MSAGFAAPKCTEPTVAPPTLTSVSTMTENVGRSMVRIARANGRAWSPRPPDRRRRSGYPAAWQAELHTPPPRPGLRSDLVMLVDKSSFLEPLLP